MNSHQSDDKVSHITSSLNPTAMKQPKICFFPGVETTCVLVVPGGCGLTPPYPFYPNLPLKPSLHKNMFNLSAPLPPSPVQPLTPVLWMNHWSPLGLSWCCLHAPDAQCSAWKEHPLSWIIRMSSYFTNTQYVWPLGLQESPQLRQYVIICYPIYRCSGSILWD